jgi:hypothetical protein
LSRPRKIQPMVALDLLAPIAHQLRLLRVIRPCRHGGANFLELANFSALLLKVAAASATLPGGPVAQWLEQSTHNALVLGSSPSRPTNQFIDISGRSRTHLADLPDHRFNTPAAHIGHEFHHHNAQADAEAAGRMLLAMMKRVNAKTPSELLVVRRS